MSIRYIAGRITESINPLRVPDAPASATATALTSSTASVSFTAPSNTGGSAITSYSVVPSSGGTVVNTTTSPASITGLSGGTAYTFQVTATNSYGVGPVITSNSITTPSLVTYFVADMYNAAGSNANQFAGTATDSSGNIYISGRQSYSGSSVDFYTAKLTSAGAITWQRKLDSTSNFDYSYATVVDSSGNVYTTGYSNVSIYSMLTTKYDSSGTLQWQRGYSDSNANFTSYDIAIDSSGNLLLIGFAQSGTFPTNNYGVLIKVNSSTGAVISYKYFRVGSEQSSPVQLYIRGVAVDASDNAYISGFYFDGATSNALLAKYNSSLTQQWNIRITGISNNAFNCGVDSSGNVYFAGGANSAAYIVKVNTSGTIQWQRALAYSGYNLGTGACCVDSSGNLYGIFGLSSFAGTVVYKIDSSGTLQWGRLLLNTTGNGNGITANRISVISNGTAIYISGYFDATATSGGPQDASLFVFPTDGTRTGSYTVNGRSFSYTPITLTQSTPTYTAGTYTFVDPGGTWTASTLSLTGSAGNLTAAITVIPEPSTVTQKAIFGYGTPAGYTNVTNLVSNTGVIATDTAGVGTARQGLAAAGYGTDKAIFAFGETTTQVNTTNLVSNTGVVSTNGFTAGTARYALAAATYGTDKAIFGYGGRSSAPFAVSETNLVTNTGGMGADVTGVGTVRQQLAAAGYGGDKAIFGYGYTSNTGPVVSLTNLVSNTGVVATDTSGVGTARNILAAASYGGDKAIFGFGSADSGNTSVTSATNLVSNTGVVSTDTTGVGTGRYGLAASNYGGDKAIFAYGRAVAGTALSMSNLVANTGVVATDVTGVGTARFYLAAAGYSLT